MIPLRDIAPPEDYNIHHTMFATSLLKTDYGKAVRASGDFTESAGITVVLVQEGEQVTGRLDILETDGMASVATSGEGLSFPFPAGQTPTMNHPIAGGKTPGTVKSVTPGSGGRGHIISVDRTNLKVLVMFP